MGFHPIDHTTVANETQRLRNNGFKGSNEELMITLTKNYIIIFMKVYLKMDEATRLSLYRHYKHIPFQVRNKSNNLHRCNSQEDISTITRYAKNLLPSRIIPNQP